MVIGLVAVYLVATGNRGLWNLYKLHGEKQDLTEKIFQLQSEITRYQNEYQAFEKDNSVIEKQAREELNLVKPGEMIYKFTSSVKP